MTAARISTARLLLRPYEESDAEARRELIDANDAHLRPWIPWMRDEPMSLDATRALLREHAARFREREMFRYVITLAESGRLVGEAGLYPRVGPGALEAGYLLDRRACGHGYAREAASAMVRVAFEVERVDRVELHCAPENAASVRIAERLAFSLRETLSDDTTPGSRQLAIWMLGRDRYPGSPAAALVLEAYSAEGERLL